MGKFKVAHFQEQGQQIVAVFVNQQFGDRPQAEQNEVNSYLQAYSDSAGLKGTVVPVWDAGDGRLGFFAPQQWHAYFHSLSLGQLTTKINFELTCMESATSE